jgi:hypothetical protein
MYRCHDDPRMVVPKRSKSVLSLAKVRKKAANRRAIAFQGKFAGVCPGSRPLAGDSHQRCRADSLQGSFGKATKGKFASVNLHFSHSGLHFPNLIRSRANGRALCLRPALAIPASPALARRSPPVDVRFGSFGDLA